MNSKLIKSAYLMVAVLLVCYTNNKISFAQQNDPVISENREDPHMKCLREIANSTMKTHI
jgi:hypothetical protein